MDKKLKVVMVSYSNSLPFSYGLKESLSKEDFEIILVNPSECAAKLNTGEAEIGLVPVAMLPLLNRHKTITNYGICANGVVRTVALFSDVPLKEIKEIYLDYQSRTSVQLVQVLARNFWFVKPSWIHAKEGYEDKISGATAAVVIGDRTFELAKKHKYVYDLSEEWFRFTKLPFVFACWVSQKMIPDEKIESINKAIEFGLEHISDAIDWFCDEKDMNKELVTDYIHNNIKYFIDDDMRKGMNLFIKYLIDKK